MGAKTGKLKNNNATESRMATPVEKISKRYPDRRKRIQKCMKNWNKRTTGNQRWPVEGTFDPACCEEVEVAIKHHKPNNTSSKRLGKKMKEREVLEWFRREGKQCNETIRTIRSILQDKCKDRGPAEPSLTLDPPPYPSDKNPFRTGQYPVVEKKEEVMELEGRVMLEPVKGTVKMTVRGAGPESKTGEGTQVRRNPESGTTPYAQLRRGLQLMTEHHLSPEDEAAMNDEGSEALEDRREYARVEARTQREEQQSAPAVKPKVHRTSTPRDERHSESHRREKDTPRKSTKRFMRGEVWIEDEKVARARQREGWDAEQTILERSGKKMDEVDREISSLMEQINETETHIKLRSGKTVPRERRERRQELEERVSEESEGMEEDDDMALQFPLMAKGNRIQYVPWSFMDMTGLAGRLPELTGGAGKWITALEENTGGVKLALGDIKALLMTVAGKHTTDEILKAVKLGRLIDGHTVDHVGFGGYRNEMWAELRRRYPDVLDPSKLDGEMLKEEGVESSSNKARSNKAPVAVVSMPGNSRHIYQTRHQ